MADPTGEAIARLGAALETVGRAAVAVSGGVDSMTLAVVAGRRLGSAVRMFHAVSPAVPAEATRRVEAYAQSERWSLAVVDAGEFDDPRYVANPLNRCYFCKTNLYGSMAARTERTLLSGTNLDDLGDYRPGLQAAQEHAVRHPYVEARITKAQVRAIAERLGLLDLAELPAAPCLSSRVETGIAIDPRDLAAIHETERAVGAALAPPTVRCRLRAGAIVIELDARSLAAVSPALGEALAAAAARAFAHRPGRAVRFAPYRMGSAFVQGPAPAPTGR